MTRTAALPAAPTVRPLGPGDVPEAAAIHAAAFHEPGPDPLERAMSALRDELGRPWARVRVACVGERVIGMAVVWVVSDTVDILDLASHPDHRRQGVGRALLEDAIALAREHGACSIMLEVRRTNVAAIALYRQAGFAAIGVRKRYYRDDEDAVQMALVLDARTGDVVRRPDEVDV
jgi:ribosomal-protein-alanine N-acetyltransferase